MRPLAHLRAALARPALWRSGSTHTPGRDRSPAQPWLAFLITERSAEEALELSPVSPLISPFATPSRLAHLPSAPLTPQLPPHNPTRLPALHRPPDENYNHPPSPCTPPPGPTGPVFNVHGARQTLPLPALLAGITCSAPTTPRLRSRLLGLRRPLGCRRHDLRARLFDLRRRLQLCSDADALRDGV